MEQERRLHSLAISQKEMKKAQAAAVDQAVGGIITVGSAASAGYVEGRFAPEIEKLGCSPVALVSAAMGVAGILTPPDKGGNYLLAGAVGTSSGVAAVQGFQTGVAHRKAADEKKKKQTTT